MIILFLNNIMAIKNKCVINDLISKPFSRSFSEKIKFKTGRPCPVIPDLADLKVIANLIYK